MTRVAELQCRCGAVHGHVTNASRESSNRILCYCDDCQAFLQHLGRSDLLDAHGGTDIVQVAPASVSFDRGGDRIVGLRLTPRGLYRWYASCCRTPVGNTLSPAIPFVGIVARAFDVGDQKAAAIFGNPRGAVYGKYGIGGVPESSIWLKLQLIWRALSLVLGWRLRGQAWPHPYFDRTTKAPSRPVVTLTRSDREALRPLCGPIATSVVHADSSAERT